MKNEMPKIPNSNHKLLKKGTKLVLSAATFGVVAAGSFQGVNYVVDNYNKQNTTVQSTNVVKTSSSTTSNVSAVAQNCMPSIVSITNVSVSDVQNYFSMYGNNSRSNPFTQQESTSVGSGVIINKKNGEIDILTNYHVIENAKTLTCTLADNTNVEATVKGVDEDRDLAVISIKTKDLSEDTLKQIAIATIGDSDKLQVGEQVVAIGNALGYGQSVTTGIVSATNRSVSTSSDTDKSQSYIQTDAAINPGNSGGALLNMSGELIGINSAKLSDTDVEGMGYAIAISDVTDTLEQLMNETPRDKVDNHGVLGITGMSVSDEASQYYGVPEGVLVSEVTDGGAADKAGIKEKSIITEFDGKRVRSIDELVSRLEYYEPGEEVEVTLEVADGDSYKEKKVTVTLGENPDADSNDSKDTSSKDDAQAEDSQDDSQDQEDQSTDSLLQDFENQQADGTAYEQFFGFLN